MTFTKLRQPIDKSLVIKTMNISTTTSRVLIGPLDTEVELKNIDVLRLRDFLTNWMNVNRKRTN